MHFIKAVKTAALSGALCAGLAHAQTAIESKATQGAASTPAAATLSRPSASSLPMLTPAPPYDASDDAARQPTMQELGLAGHVDLAPMRERADRKLRDWKLQALVGQMEHLGGDRAAAEARYQHAVDAAGKNDKRLRHVLWSRGWARLYSGDNEGALLDWREAAKLHGGKPEWYPHTLALAYWRAGQRAVGMQWFEASQLAKSEDGQQRLPYLDLPLIAQSLIGDMFYVRNLRAKPGTPRLAAGAPKLQWPAYIASPPPKFPRLAAMSRMQGRVLSLACVDARGHVKATYVRDSSGHAMLDKSATDAIAGWQFRPEMCGGKPRDSWVAVPIDYALATLPAGARIPESFRRRPKFEDAFDRTQRDSQVGLDAEGFTAVTSNCDSDVLCTAGSTWAAPRDVAPKTAGGATP